MSYSELYGHILNCYNYRKTSLFDDELTVTTNQSHTDKQTESQQNERNDTQQAHQCGTQCIETDIMIAYSYNNMVRLIYCKSLQQNRICSQSADPFADSPSWICVCVCSCTYASHCPAPVRRPSLLLLNFCRNAITAVKAFTFLRGLGIFQILVNVIWAYFRILFLLQHLGDFWSVMDT